MPENNTHEVFVVTATPLPGNPNTKTLDWDESRDVADEIFAEFVEDYGTTDSVTLWSAQVPDKWDIEDTTLYLSEVDHSDIRPIKVHNG